MKKVEDNSFRLGIDDRPKWFDKLRDEGRVSFGLEKLEVKESLYCLYKNKGIVYKVYYGKRLKYEHGLIIEVEEQIKHNL